MREFIGLTDADLRPNAVNAARILIDRAIEFDAAVSDAKVYKDDDNLAASLTVLETGEGWIVVDTFYDPDTDQWTTTTAKELL